MLTNPTLETLEALKLHGMVEALEEQQQTPPIQALSFEERLSLSSIASGCYRDNQRTTRLLRGAHLKVAAGLRRGHQLQGRPRPRQAPDRNARQRGLDPARPELLITGATGSGKTWLACALAQQACRQGLSVLYWRVPRLFEETAHRARRRQLHASS